MKLRLAVLAVVLGAFASVLALEAQRGGPGGPGGVDPDKAPFEGITTDGTVVGGLFAIRSTGVSTQPVVDAAAQFLASLTREERTSTTFPVDDSEWRRWNNIHRAQRPVSASRR